MTTTGLQKILFALLRSSVSEQALTAEEKAQFAPELLEGLFALSKKHDIAHLVGVALKKNGLLDQGTEAAKYFQKEMMTAVFRYEQIQYEYDCLCKRLTALDVPFIPLKGSVLRDYYPEAWLRTSSDIDVLVPKPEAERVAAALMEQYRYEKDCDTPYNIALFSPEGVHVEIHFDLVENGQAQLASKILENIWDTASLQEGTSHQYVVSDAMFYFYHIAHMAKHFECGGCGVRPFIDLWILDRMEGVDKAARDTLLEQGRLLQFTETCRALSRIWFAEEATTEVTARVQEYILNGGVYGNLENGIAVRQQKQGGRFRYTMAKIFLPYSQLKQQYPVLQKHKWLTPFMEVRRWCKLLFCGHTKRVVKDMKKSKQIWKEQGGDTRRLLLDIGLLDE